MAECEGKRIRRGNYLVAERTKVLDAVASRFSPMINIKMQIGSATRVYSLGSTREVFTDDPFLLNIYA